MLLRFDPFRDFDRLAEPRRQASIPVDAVRRGNHVVLSFDVPGVRADDLDITVERNVLTITADRARADHEGDEALASERTFGTFRRQFHLAETLDLNQLEADLADGVLTLRVPVAETAKPRKVQVRTAEPAPAELSA